MQREPIRIAGSRFGYFICASSIPPKSVNCERILPTSIEMIEFSLLQPNQGSTTTIEVNIGECLFLYLTGFYVIL